MKFLFGTMALQKGLSDNSFHIQKEKVNSTKIIESQKILIYCINRLH